MSDCTRGNHHHRSKHHKKRRRSKRPEPRDDCYDKEKKDQTTNDYLDGKYKKPTRKTTNSSEKEKDTFDRPVERKREDDLIERTDTRHKSKERTVGKESTERHRSKERQKSADRTERHRSSERNKRFKTTERTESHRSSKRKQNELLQGKLGRSKSNDRRKRNQSRDRAETHRPNEQKQTYPLTRHDTSDRNEKRQTSDRTSRRRQSRDRAERRLPCDTTEDYHISDMTRREKCKAASSETADDQLQYESKKHDRNEKRKSDRQEKMGDRRHTREEGDLHHRRLEEESSKKDKSGKFRYPDNDLMPSKKTEKKCKVIITSQVDIDGSTRRHDEPKIRQKLYDSDCLNEMNMESLHNEKDSSADKEDLLSDVDPSVKHHHSKYARRKKEKRVKTKKHKKPHEKQKRRSRLYHSDSELEVVKSKTRKGKSVSTSDVSVDLFKDQPININALYNLLYRDTDVHNESDVIKDAMKRKMYQSDTVQTKSRTQTTNTLKPVLLDQSSVRSKLIKVLFQRVKDLLKETEELREERKSLCQKIENLTSEVDELKRKNLKQSVQEEKIKERLDILADEMKITTQGTSFREEVHSILHNIQDKYQSHWKEHETKINQVQTDAEHEIQSLLKNIVGKYVQLTELKNHGKYNQGNVVQQRYVNALPKEQFPKDNEEVPRSLRLSNQGVIQNKLKPSFCEKLMNKTQLLPLHIQIDDEVSPADRFDEHWKIQRNKICLQSGEDMLLKIADPIRTSTQADVIKGNIAVRHQNNMVKQYGSYLYQPDGKDSTSPALSISDASRSAVEYKLGELKSQFSSNVKSCTGLVKFHGEQMYEKKIEKDHPPQGRYEHAPKQHEGAHTSSSTISQSFPIFDPGKTCMLQNKECRSQNRDTKLQPGENRQQSSLYTKQNCDNRQGTVGECARTIPTLSVKLDSKEFWRNRLLQPKPLERLREEGFETSRNQL